MKLKNLIPVFLFIIICFVFFSCPTVAKEEDEKEKPFIPTWSTEFNFDTNNGAWTPTGDWQWTNTYDVLNYTGSNVPPTAAHSGAGLWGTVIYDDYNNSGSSSYLSRTFDFTGSSIVKLSLYVWVNCFYTWDWCKIYINNTQVWDYGTYNTSPSWELVNIDLSAYGNNNSVEIKFELYASTVVEKAGFYIDDIKIEGN